MRATEEANETNRKKIMQCVYIVDNNWFNQEHCMKCIQLIIIFIGKFAENILHWKKKHFRNEKFQGKKYFHYGTDKMKAVNIHTAVMTIALNHIFLYTFHKSSQWMKRTYIAFVALSMFQCMRRCRSFSVWSVSLRVSRGRDCI